ncbi:MAG: hypothetical protein KJO35_00890, partial [Gammaproteobacteria bacterium]|nr:hypothetical protein [Gammaproteobacteria bacterium]
MKPKPHSGDDRGGSVGKTSRREPAAVAVRSAPRDLPWRVTSLLNIYRVFVATALILMYLATSDEPIVGALRPTLFLIITSVYLLAGLTSWWTISRRSPDYPIQVGVLLVIDIAVIAAVMHTSGGISSGLGNLLIISVGASSLILSTRTAVTFAAFATLII